MTTPSEPRTGGRTMDATRATAESDGVRKVQEAARSAAEAQRSAWRSRDGWRGPNHVQLLSLTLMAMDEASAKGLDLSEVEARREFARQYQTHLLETYIRDRP